MAPKKNRRPRHKHTQVQNTGNNGPNALGSYWVAQLTGTRKTLDSEFPALPSTATSGPTENKDNWISPADLQDPSGWSTGGTLGWNFCTGDDALAEGYWDKTVGQLKKGRAALRPYDSLVDTSEPSEPSETSNPKAWVDPTPVKTEEELRKEQAIQNCVGWPWMGVPQKLITLSPYHLNLHPEKSVLSLPRVNQESAFFKRLMNVNDTAFLVLKLVFRHHSSAWKLAATCQQMWELISDNVDIWDVTSGYFGNCDKTVDAQNSHPFAAGSVSAHLIVTPFRRPEGPASYLEQVRSIRGLCLSIDNFKHSLRNVHFHRVPFLSINILALLIPQMTKLEVLGVYNCRLMHLGTALKLLDLLTVDRMKGKEHSVSLDFYPNYHLGPEEGGKYNVGTYGVCWDNLNFDTCMGIWSLTKRIVTKARKQGIDLESPHTMFRQWLEKTPCWVVGPTLDAFFDPKKTALEVAAMVQYRFTHGSIAYLQSLQGYTHDPSWWGRGIQCKDCGEIQMGVFFSINNARVDPATGQEKHPQCYGCLLTYYLRRETDHYKTEKRRIVKQWLREDDGTTVTWNTTDLHKAIEDYELNNIEQMAADLDELRQKEMTQGPDAYDKETQERQRPLTEREARGKRGGHLRSPDVNSWKSEEYAYLYDHENYKWIFQFHNKYDGHGHIY